MAALTSASITIVLLERSKENKKRKVKGTLAIAGTDTYPTGGIPLPAIGSFGFIRQMDKLEIVGQPGATSQYLYNYDETNHKLQIFEEEATAAGGPLLEADTSEAPGARTLRFVAEGW